MKPFKVKNTVEIDWSRKLPCIIILDGGGREKKWMKTREGKAEPR